MTMPDPRVNVTPEDVGMVVSKFYAAVREHPVLGPVFYLIIGQSEALWREHEEKIAAFWRNAILYEREYSGNPMLAHLGASAIESKHFPIWLGLFERVLIENLSQEQAQDWSLLANRIGRGLKFGMETFRQIDGKVPNLRNL
jgi:hemoglobin